MTIFDLGYFEESWANQIILSFLKGMCKIENFIHFLCFYVLGEGLWVVFGRDRRGLDIIWLYYLVINNGFEF